VKILISGAGGQVARALVDSQPAHLELVALTRAELDITDARAVAHSIRLHAPDVIVNAAAYTAVDRAESEPDIAEKINTEGPRHLALAARETGARLVHLSTDFVFDGTASVPYAPEAVTNPLSTYGRTKRAGEEAVLRTLPRHAVILRTAWVYAAQGRNFVQTMLRLMRAGGAVRVVADQVGTPTSARSLAELVWVLLANPEMRGIHHWTDAGIASWYDFAVAIAEEAATLDLLPRDVTVTPIATSEYPTPARRPAYAILDKRSLQPLGVVPVHWRKRLREVLKEIRGA
jgi:dTDP-4-dehydrorhamnose reductase